MQKKSKIKYTTALDGRRSMMVNTTINKKHVGIAEKEVLGRRYDQRGKPSGGVIPSIRRALEVKGCKKLK
jgi:hypothetical protein